MDATATGGDEINIDLHHSTSWMQWRVQVPGLKVSVPVTEFLQKIDAVLISEHQD